MLRKQNARIEQWCSATRKEFTEGVDLLLRYWKCSSVLRQNVISDVLTFLEPASDSDSLIKRLKWLCAYPMARLFGESSEEIFQPLRWTGLARRWFRAKLYRNSENSKLWFSWFQLKRCTETVPEEFVHSQALKHRAAMDKPPSNVIQAGLLLQLNRMRLPWVDRIDPKMAPTVSRSACLENSRAAGGAFWFLKLLDPPKPDPRESTWTVEGVGFVHNGQWMDLPFFRRKRNDDQVFLDFLRTEALANETSFAPEARVEFVLEPLKVRTITKGPAALYSFARCWQRCYHDALKRVPGFQLIGRPIEALDIAGLLSPTGGVLDPNWEFTSIDYSSATDNLDGRLTQKCLQRIAQGLPFEDYDLLRRAVGMHTITYPPRLGIDPVEQRNGQLMGSPVSFPILCVINAASIRAADDELGLGSTLPFLVNGDDALVYRPRGWRSVHEKYSSSAGLTYSVGKVYTSDQYANMNSVGFWVEKSGKVSRLDYIPVGLMRGHHKLAEESYQDDTGVLGALDQTLRSCLERPGFALRQFISLNKGDLRRACAGRNLFICRPEGGLGFEPPQGWRFSISDKQREWAGSCKVELSRERLFDNPNVLYDAWTEQWVLDHDRWKDKPNSRITHPLRGTPKEPHIGQWFLAPSEAGLCDEQSRGSRVD